MIDFSIIAAGNKDGLLTLIFVVRALTSLLNICFMLTYMPSFCHISSQSDIMAASMKINTMEVQTNYLVSYVRKFVDWRANCESGLPHSFRSFCRRSLMNITAISPLFHAGHQKRSGFLFKELGRRTTEPLSLLSALVKFLFLAVNQLQLSGLICSPRYLYESSVNMPGDSGYKHHCPQREFYPSLSSSSSSTSI